MSPANQKCMNNVQEAQLPQRNRVS